jgi:mono/diheme cytochrome c family protein
MVSFKYPDILCLSSVLVWLAVVPVHAQDAAAIARGEYVFRAAGGCSCHTDAKNNGAFMAGGRSIKTPFGQLYSTNITPAPKTGIGTWNDADFLQAMTEGVGPDGRQYFPVFPYTSFTRMTRQDVLDLKAYLFSLPAVEQANKPPGLWPLFLWRFAIRVWKWLFFRPGTFQANPTHPPAWNRGAYLATALGHCTECHTPRNLLGGLKTPMTHAGSLEGPEGELAPNITPDKATGIGAWSIPDLVWFFQTGLKPDGDDTQGLMSELITNGYKYLSEADLQAIAEYIRTLPPIHNKVPAKDRKKD